MKLKLDRCFLFLQAFFIFLCSSFCSNQKIRASVAPELPIEDVQEINLMILNFNSTKWKCLSNAPRIEVNRRFRIRVKHNVNDALLVNRIGRCTWWSWWPTLSGTSGDRYTSVVFTKDYNNDDFVSDVLDISTRSGAWPYECIFYFENAVCDYYNGSKCVVTTSSGSNATDQGVSCHVEIRIVHTQSGSLIGHLTGNNKHFYPGPEYQDYRFHDGEGTNFTCYGIAEDYAQVKLDYYKKGVLNFTNKQIDSLSKYLTLTADNDGDSLECIYYDQHHFTRQIIKLKLNVDKNTRASSIWVAVLAGVLALGNVIAVTVIIVWRYSGRPSGLGDGASPASPPNDSQTDMNHVYEDVDCPCPVYDVPYADFAPVAPAPHDMTDRAACPLPEQPEGLKYIHYATPYEFRIFRPGFPAL